MNETRIPAGIPRGFFWVFDKNGMPKVDNMSTIPPEALNDLTPEQRQYLEIQHADIDNRSA